MTTKVVGVGVVLFVLVGIGGYYLLNSRLGGVSAPATKEFVLEVVNKKLVEGAETLRVREGDTVVVTISGGEREEFHLHGYDRSVDIEPGHEATLTFVADVSGRFPFELEYSKTELGSLEVLP